MTAAATVPADAVAAGRFVARERAGRAGDLGEDVYAAATGGVAAAARAALEPACRRIDHHDPWLTLKGLRLVWDRNT